MTRDKPRMLAIDDTPANLITLGAARASEHDLQSLLRPDEVESCRHTGEGRYPVSESDRRLDPGTPRALPAGRLRRGDEFILLRASSITSCFLGKTLCSGGLFS